ncbi:MAG: peptide ABC transporter substrate-binding protein [Thermomicrobiales bacterium]|nr:peptide ABC transporter substrate-binding protein [Thermomicrobiales bacterium]MCO5217428.1 peptide ABC transporter substrate-binding protein [Thermomicrobiales bacterium]MCO5226046.1 peptide ABC transporter substrate-binding protein [Thermomicrobiales bacterium]MCO5226732.1 peptide ABC transporter substrate-binding protein [Thermomicrobiales bacterium]
MKPDVRNELDELLHEAFSNRQSRRTLMQRTLAVGGAAGLAYVFPRAIVAQEAGESSPGVHVPAPEGVELAEEQHIRLSMSEPDSMDPGVSSGYDELGIFFNIFDGLTGIDMITGEVVPRCAESWDINEDGTEFTFHLRDNLKWSNGESITAADFEYSWKRVLDPETLSLYRPAMHPIKNGLAIDAEENPMDFNELGVHAVDELTLHVMMEEPTPFFPLLASTWTYCPVPKSAVEEHGDAWVEAENIVSNGPFKMVEWSHDQRIVLEQNEHFYGDTPTITRAEYTIFPDDSTQEYTSYENDELDFVWPESGDLERIAGDETAMAEIHTFEQSNCRMVTCDAKTEPTSNADFRRALYAAIDRDVVADVILKGTATAALNVVPADIPGNNPDATNPVGEEAALAALAASGYDPSTIELEYSYRTSGNLKLVAEYLEQRWPEVLGIKVKLNPIDASTYSDYNMSRKDQPFNTKYGTWGSDFADPSNWHNQNFVSWSDHYYLSWKNEEYDALAKEAVSETDPERRAELYRQAEVILVEDAAYIPVYRGVGTVAIKPWVVDFHMQPILAYVHLRLPKIAAH